MANKKQEPMGDTDLLARVEEKARRAVGYMDSRLSKERQRVIQYYNSELPKRQNEGKSSYVSTDCYDSIEAMKSQLLETFSGNPDGLISFPARGPQDQKLSRIATEYCSYQIFELNDGYDAFHDAIHDGLTARVGISKVYWDKRLDDVEESFDSLSQQDVMALAAQEDITELNADETDVGSGTFKGTLLRQEDNSQVAIDPVAPEEFLIEQRAKSIKKADYTAHRTLKTRAELLREGYPKDKVETINWADARTLDLQGENIVRNMPVTDGIAPMDDSVQPEMQKIMLYESYMRVDLHDGRGAKLYKIVHAGNTLLEKEEVDRAPFIDFVPLRVSHIFHGNNFGARVISTQNARTVLTRAVLDHAAVTTNPRWGVVQGGLLNPKEMLDNRLGGIVNLKRPDAIVPFEQPSLNPFVFQTLEMLKTNKEESTGISSLSQGLNKDAISTQNSAALVDNLVTLSQQRQKIIARNFARYVVALYLEVYRLVLLNEKKQRIIEVAGDWQQVNVNDWVERKTCKIALHLGYGERDQQAQTIGGAYAQMAQDPGLGNLISDQNRYNMVTDFMRLKRMENWGNYITPPQQAQPKQPDPLKVQELQIKGKLADAATTTSQANALKNERQAEVAALKEQLNELKLHITALFQQKEAQRKDLDVHNRVNVTQREMALAEKYPPTNQEPKV
jgi:hypothetical protein